MLSTKNVNELTNTESIISFADKLKERLEPAGRENFLAIAIRIAPFKYASELMKTAMVLSHARQPIAPLISYTDEAPNWLRFVDIAERKFYLMRIWESLSPEERKAFWKYSAGWESQNG